MPYTGALIFLLVPLPPLAPSTHSQGRYLRSTGLEGLTTDPFQLLHTSTPASLVLEMHQIHPISFLFPWSPLVECDILPHAAQTSFIHLSIQQIFMESILYAGVTKAWYYRGH